MFRSRRKDDDEELPLVNPSISHPIYIKAFMLREKRDVAKIKAEIVQGNILVIGLAAIVKRSPQETGMALRELVAFSKSIHGDIARLGNERIILTPPTIKVWREAEPLTVEASDEDSR